MKVIFVVAVLMGAVGSAAAQNPPPPPTKKIDVRQAKSLPPTPPIAIPQELSPPQDVYAAFPESSDAAAAPAAPSACQLHLAKIATFRPIGTLVGAGECGAVDVVLLDSVVLLDQAKVAVAPPATLRCTMAEQVARWVREDVAPTTTKLGAPLRGLDNFDSYECRGRNRVQGATLSEHGRANALDVRAFKLADGRSIALIDVNADKEWRDEIRRSACARFSTVLGPGSDGEHEGHIHLDLAERRNNYKICQWDVREPVAQVQDIAPQAEAAVLDDEVTAPLPLDDVPLPRPRPRVTSNAHRSSGLEEFWPWSRKRPGAGPGPY